MISKICLILWFVCNGVADDNVSGPYETFDSDVPRETNIYVPEEAWEWRDLLCESLMESFGSCNLLSHSAAKVMQESAWDCTAYSRYAGGCSQFTQDTAKWMAKGYCRDLGKFYPKIVEEPEWALPCMVRYDKFHYDRVEGTTFAERIAKIDSAYNGGLGWLYKDEKICDSVSTCNSMYWYNHVELYSNRADWAIKENREYVTRINHFLTDQYLKVGYGGVRTSN